MRLRAAHSSHSASMFGQIDLSWLSKCQTVPSRSSISSTESIATSRPPDPIDRPVRATGSVPRWIICKIHETIERRRQAQRSEQTMTESPGVHPDTSDMAPVHKVFRSSLATAPDFVGSAAGDDERRAIIANYYANLIAFLEAHHEGEEEIIFPRLIERAPEHRSAVEQGASQHAEVVGLMLAVNQSVASWEVKGDSEASEMLRSLQALDSVLSPHLDQEEAEIVPLAAEYLTVEEWGSLPGHAMANFGGDKIWLIMGLIRELHPETAGHAGTHAAAGSQMWQNMGKPPSMS